MDIFLILIYLLPYLLGVWFVIEVIKYLRRH